ncbi:glucose PTS transporter transcription antiterminator GlcT [Bacillus xiapuensis]|uniref:glucose PTS transporter transcription antiterminator GlcT n=1 Tax=Bacillus xiapuensis TaxID=2014075 RepID=UPI000C23F4A4|nr:transcription antiterminator [Bacillus xiapuensis]
MQGSFVVRKALNNNVLIASHAEYDEVVLIGKGIGFGKKNGDPIAPETIEKLFILKSEQEQEQYKQLLNHIDERFIGLMNDVISLIQKRVNAPLNEHIHVALTDHIYFAIKRIQQGMDLKNPFLLETKVMYPHEYTIAAEVIEMINERMEINLPNGEIGFIALHIHSALTAKRISEVNKHSQLIQTIIEMIEHAFHIAIDRDSIYYMRLIRHLHFTIERVKAGERAEEPKKIALLLKEEYPLCYNLSCKIIKVMQQALKLPVYEAEAVYLTMHLQRLVVKTELA